MHDPHSGPANNHAAGGVVIVAQETVAHDRPGARPYRVMSCVAHRPPLPLVTDKVAHACPQRLEVTRRVEPARPAVVDKVEQPARSDGYDGQATGHCLLGDLAEGLVRAWVDDDVEARKRPRQVRARRSEE